ncbi:hypothetical protein RUND412_010391 [Rhizina undulata]
MGKMVLFEFSREKRGKHEQFIPAEGIEKAFFEKNYAEYIGQDAEWKYCTHMSSGREGYLITVEREISQNTINRLRRDSTDARTRIQQESHRAYFEKLHAVWRAEAQARLERSRRPKNIRLETPTPEIPHINLPTPSPIAPQPISPVSPISHLSRLSRVPPLFPVSPIASLNHVPSSQNLSLALSPPGTPTSPESTHSEDDDDVDDEFFVYSLDGLGGPGYYGWGFEIGSRGERGDGLEQRPGSSRSNVEGGDEARGRWGNGGLGKRESIGRCRSAGALRDRDRGVEREGRDWRQNFGWEYL